jgi:hypothetical protein
MKDAFAEVRNRRRLRRDSRSVAKTRLSSSTSASRSRALAARMRTGGVWAGRDAMVTGRATHYQDRHHPSQAVNFFSEPL